MSVSLKGMLMFCVDLKSSQEALVAHEGLRGLRQGKDFGCHPPAPVLVALNPPWFY